MSLKDKSHSIVFYYFFYYSAQREDVVPEVAKSRIHKSIAKYKRGTPSVFLSYISCIDPWKVMIGSKEKQSCKAKNMGPALT